jgi:hypothetical protein
MWLKDFFLNISMNNSMYIRGWGSTHWSPHFFLGGGRRVVYKGRPAAHNYMGFT